MVKPVQSSGKAPQKGADAATPLRESDPESVDGGACSEEEAQRRRARRRALEMLEQNLGKIYDLPI